MPEPRDPLLKVVGRRHQTMQTEQKSSRPDASHKVRQRATGAPRHANDKGPAYAGHEAEQTAGCATAACTRSARPEASLLPNDPSAGSPTETLLRLLLPLND